MHELYLSYIWRVNWKKYWKRRMAIQKIGGATLVKSYYLIWLRRKESFFGATTGTGKGWVGNNCCRFNEKIKFPHGFSGIVIAQNVEFKGNATIFQHVTISEDDRTKKTVIGENAILGAGSVILNNVSIGNCAFVGANAVVTKDVPDNAVVVGVPARIIKIKEY